MTARLCSPNSKYHRHSEEGQLRAGNSEEEIKFDLDF